VTQRWLGVVTQAGTTVHLAGPADLIGIGWQGAADASVWVRFARRDGSFSAWVSAASRGHGPEGVRKRDTQVGEPIWTGGTSVVQVRAATALRDVQLHMVRVAPLGVGQQWLAGTAAALAGPVPLAGPSLRAGAGQPPIIARRAWAGGVAVPAVAPQYGHVRMAFVHHTESSNGYGASEVPAMLRAIYAFHRYVNGWNDIGYNFVVDRYGRIFEARAGGIDEPVVGAHAGGYNLVSTGVAVLGSFSAVPISRAARDALQRLLAWKLSLHGVPAAGSVTVRVNPAGAAYSRFPANAHVTLPRIAGHRDADTTECPGSVLYGELPGVRRRVARLAPDPTIVTLALRKTQEGSPQPATTEGAAPTGQAAPTEQVTPTERGTPTEQGAPTEPGGGTGQTELSTAPVGTSVSQWALAGAVELQDGTAVANAAVLIQARTVRRRGEVVHERTVAQVTTNVEGRWELLARPTAGGHGDMHLRALYAGDEQLGAGVSAPVSVTRAVSFAQAPASAGTELPA
jgi:hypothetical protein